MVGTSHPRAAWFIEHGLFRGIRTFDELEAQIRASPDANPRGDKEKVKGDAWEIFVEGYLATQPQFNIRTHSEKSVAPQSWLDRLKISRPDKGIDGIFETRDGRLGAQQSKFRADGHRTSLNEGVNKLDSRAKHADVRIYVTNARSYDDTEVGSLVEEGRIHWIGGNTFEQLKPGDFDNIAKWIEGAKTPRVRKTPDGDRDRGQAQAIEHVVRGPNGFAHHDRCKMVVVSAAGKTLTGMFIAEAMQDVRTVLVLVPWRILVRQTLLEWLENTSWDPDEFEFRCVVSENNAATADDLAAFRDSVDDLSDVLVTRDAATIREFLTNKNGKRKLVVSTYHSSGRVAEAMPRGMAFDLAIFDEAHRTAMPGGSYWTLALENCTNKPPKWQIWKRDPSPNGLSCKKRLFMTATERINRIRARPGQDGEDEPVFSMDDTEVYGPTAHELGYARAVEMELVLPLRFHLTFALDEETENAIDQGVIRQLQDSLGRELSAEEYAVAQSIVQTMNESDISKVFTFHNRVERSKTMQALLRRELQEGSVVHQIDGSTPHSTRAAMFRDMEGDMPCVITSVGTIREGVNVPVVQMVSLADPRSDPIDVTQIAGRAMRRNDATGKEYGDVHIPILLQRAEGEAGEDAFDRSSYRTAIQTLKALETTVPIVQLLTMRLRGRGYRRRAGRDAPTDEETLNNHEIHVHIPPGVGQQQIINGLCNEIRTSLGRSAYDLLEIFRMHVENGGDAYVPQGLENPEGFEIPIHFGVNIKTGIRQVRSRIEAGVPQPGDHWMTEQVIQEFDNAGFLWNSPDAGDRGRPMGRNNVPRGNVGTRIYIAALREFRRQNPCTGLLPVVKPQSGTTGSIITVEFEGQLYENVRLGHLRTNLRRKKNSSKMNIEEYWLWVNEGLDLTDYSINDRLPEGYDQTPETLRARLEARGMSSQEHQMWTEHGVDLGEYDPQRHTQLDPLDTLAEGE